MTFQGPDPYGTPGGFPGPLTVGIVDDTRQSDGKTYIAFLVVNSTVIERRRSEIENIIRVIGEGGVPIVAIAITEGNIATGTVIDSAMTELRLGSQDFVVQQVSPGIDLVTLERNIVAPTMLLDSANASTTLVNTDLLCITGTLVLPGPSSSLWTVYAALFVVCNATGAANISVRADIVHAGGTVVGGVHVDPSTPTGANTTRITRVGSVGVITGGQTLTFNGNIKQDIAGTLTKRIAMIIVEAYRTT